MTVAAPHAAATALGTELAWGGSLAVTSDYIYRGVSESNGRAALQADVHADTPQGTFAGARVQRTVARRGPGAGKRALRRVGGAGRPPGRTAGYPRDPRGKVNAWGGGS